jgi:cytochrome c5
MGTTVDSDRINPWCLEKRGGWTGLRERRSQGRPPKSFADHQRAYPVPLRWARWIARPWFAPLSGISAVLLSGKPLASQSLDRIWRGWRGSNPRPLASEANTLSTELQPQRFHSIRHPVVQVCGKGRLAIIIGCLQPSADWPFPLLAPIRHPLEDTMSDHANESHTGPIKTPAQLLWTSFFSFVAPIFIIIGLVMFVTSGNKPAAGAADPELATAMRIQRVGSVELRDANRPLQAGADVYKAQCLACHDAGLAGAPKLGDAGAWSARISKGYDALLTSALKGKGAMGAQGGGAYSDVEIGRAVVHMANAAGAKFAVPQAPAAPAADAAPAAAAPAAATVVATAAATVAKPAASSTVAAGAGEALYKQACAACHSAGVAGAPKFADKSAWAARLPAGVNGLTASVIKGKGAMPPKGGASAASDADIRAAVEYMVAAAK